MFLTSLAICMFASYSLFVKFSFDLLIDSFKLAVVSKIFWLIIFNFSSNESFFSSSILCFTGSKDSLMLFAASSRFWLIMLSFSSYELFFSSCAACFIGSQTLSRLLSLKDNICSLSAASSWFRVFISSLKLFIVLSKVWFVLISLPSSIFCKFENSLPINSTALERESFVIVFTLSSVFFTSSNKLCFKNVSIFCSSISSLFLKLASSMLVFSLFCETFAPNSSLTFAIWEFRAPIPVVSILIFSKIWFFKLVSDWVVIWV